MLNTLTDRFHPLASPRLASNAVSRTSVQYAQWNETLASQSKNSWIQNTLMCFLCPTFEYASVGIFIEMSSAISIQFSIGPIAWNQQSPLVGWRLWLCPNSSCLDLMHTHTHTRTHSHTRTQAILYLFGERRGSLVECCSAAEKANQLHFHRTNKTKPPKVLSA
jgi:hypothetical protein